MSCCDVRKTKTLEIEWKHQDKEGATCLFSWGSAGTRTGEGADTRSRAALHLADATR
jgi:hypothetical protein